VILDVRTIDGHGWFRQRIESRHAVFDVLDLLAFFGVTIPFGIASARPPLERFSAGGTYCFFGFDFHIFMSLMPNQSPEPMTVGRRSSASRVMLWCPSWLSFVC
jgi:hypothetical protein